MSFEEKRAQLFSIGEQLSGSPYPAWVLGATLLSKGLLVSRPMSYPLGTSGGSFKLHQKLVTAKPTRASCLTFGVAQMLGGWIIYDGDVSNGAGFTFAWSTLYLLVNGKSSLHSFFKGRVSPLGIGLLAVGNATIYGKRFFWP
ncbi:uncharacterized protein PRCAT00005196001 [Priceomyces carsonii]|uniref:uncharacterized protein n=1 Tax=Priceomyces carsonii TaxID=28549 RepID=UPI002ED8F68C|nr:unnamed protein product [Priceomyces carsonii]